MKITTIYKNMLLAVLLCYASACEDKLNEYNPSGLTAEEVYRTPEGFESLVNASYSYARWWYGKEEGYGLSEMGTDIWMLASDNRQPEIMTYNNLQSTQAFLLPLWSRFYEAINVCNAGLKYVDESGLSADKKKIREGELRFLRAFYYWHLVEQWGDIPMPLNPTESAVTTAKRTAVATVYQEVIFPDLEKALSLLQHPASEWGRVSKGAAEAFLARMYLTRKNYPKAYEHATNVIEDYSYSLEGNYADLWNMANQQNEEVIWAVTYSTDLGLNDARDNTLYPNGHNRGSHNGHLMFQMTYDRNGTYGMTRDIENGRPFARYKPTLFLLELFNEQADARYQASFQTLWRANKPGTYPHKITGQPITLALGDTALFATRQAVPNNVKSAKKYIVYDKTYMYKPDGTSANNQHYVALKKFQDPTRGDFQQQQSARDAFVIRLAEMYLIAAEAALLGAVDGGAAKAAELVNVLRLRATIPGKEAQMQVSAAEMSLSFMLDERARELAGEQLRWFDLKRTETLLARVTAANPEAKPYIKDYHVLRPIAQEQLDAVTNKAEFKQNPGYN